MRTSAIDKVFLAIWHQANKTTTQENFTPELISALATAKGLVVESIKVSDVGAFQTTKSIVLTVANGQACFPLTPILGDERWQQRRRHADHEADLFKKMDWFCPLWMAMGKVRELLRDVKTCNKERAVELLDYHTSTVYTLPFQAVCIEQLWPQSRSLMDFTPLGREAYLAFYSGHRASSIAALIPVIEGALSRIVSSNDSKLSPYDKVNKVIDRAIHRAARIHFEQMWTPNEYLTSSYLFGHDERVFVFETFRNWLNGTFFQQTGEYNGTTGLNRHLFAHGISDFWQKPGNFQRLVVAITTLGVIEAWQDESSGISLFFPEMSEESKLLWEQAIFNMSAQVMLKEISEKRYHEQGRLVPKLPTDDGVLHRQALLTTDCINDLVRPMRNAGWNIEVAEPDEKALWITIVAHSEQRILKVALLYSCATDNKLYKQLAETCDVILYRGAPYHQKQFAHGLQIHVGPVTAWQPPLAKTSHC